MRLRRRLHFSPRGEAKCGRGPAGRGPSRPRRQHGFYVFHESRVTKHESWPLRPFGSPWVPRVAQAKTAARTATPACPCLAGMQVAGRQVAWSLLPLPTIACHDTEYPADLRRIPTSTEKSLLAVRNFPVFPGKKYCPEPVSAHRPPFSLGLTTKAVSRSSRRPPGSFCYGQHRMNPC